MIEYQKAKTIIKKVVSGYIPDAEIRLFGSRATGTSNADSDYDILIITDQVLSATEKFPLKTFIRKDLLSYGLRSDILIQNRKEVAIKRELPGHIIRNIMKETIIL